MQLVNGKQSELISIRDRGLQFGDGCFTTALVKNGQIQRFSAHIARLQQDCQCLAITNVDWHALTREMQQVAMGHQQIVIKVMLTRGEGTRGYSSQCQAASRIIYASPYPQQYARWRKRGIRLLTSPIRLSVNPQLAGIKHLNRIEQVLIRHQLDSNHAEEALVLDYAGHIIECGSANIFWRIGGKMFTPELTHCGVNGIMRRYLISVLEKQGHTVECLRVEKKALANADEVFVCNALMPVVPVTQIDQQTYQIGELTQGLAAVANHTETL